MTPLFGTILIDPQSSLLAGAIIPIVAYRLLKRDPEKESRRMILLGAIWGLTYGLAVSTMYFRYSDWMFGYMLDTKTFPVAALWPVFIAANVFSGAAAAAISATMVKSGKTWVAALCALGALACLLTVWLPHMDGYMHMGSTAEYRAGTAPQFPGPADAQSGMNLAGAITTVVSLGMIGWIVRRSMKPA